MIGAGARAKARDGAQGGEHEIKERDFLSRSRCPSPIWPGRRARVILLMPLEPISRSVRSISQDSLSAGHFDGSGVGVVVTVAFAFALALTRTRSGQCSGGPQCRAVAVARALAASRRQINASRAENLLGCPELLIISKQQQKQWRSRLHSSGAASRDA